MIEKNIPFKASAVLINVIIAVLFWIWIIMVIVKKLDDFLALFTVLLLIILTGGFRNSLNAFFRFSKRKPAIKLTQENFLENVSNLNFKWEDIKGFNEYSFGRHTFISIELKNQKEYIAQIKNPRKRITYWLNFKMTGYHLHINTQFMDLKKKDLLNSLLHYRAQAIIENRRQNKKNRL